MQMHVGIVYLFLVETCRTSALRYVLPSRVLEHALYVGFRPSRPDSIITIRTYQERRAQQQRHHDLASRTLGQTNNS